MKKILPLLGSVLILLLFFFSVSYAAVFESFDCSANGDCEILAAVEDKKHHIKTLYLVLDTKELATVQCGDTDKIYHYAAADTPVVYELQSGELECADDEAINLAKTTAGTKAYGWLRYEDR
jgi:hypothetical protein